jgi:hypothetical protein
LEIDGFKVGLGFNVFIIQMWWVPLIKEEVVGNLQIVVWLNKLKTHKDRRVNVSEISDLKLI